MYFSSSKTKCGQNISFSFDKKIPFTDEEVKSFNRLCTAYSISDYIISAEFSESVIILDDFFGGKETNFNFNLVVECKKHLKLMFKDIQKYCGSYYLDCYYGDIDKIVKELFTDTTPEESLFLSLSEETMRYDDFIFGFETDDLFDEVESLFYDDDN